MGSRGMCLNRHLRCSIVIAYRHHNDETTKRAKRSEEHTSELQSPDHLVCRLLLEKKKKYTIDVITSFIVTILSLKRPVVVTTFDNRTGMCAGVTTSSRRITSRHVRTHHLESMRP